MKAPGLPTSDMASAMSGSAMETCMKESTARARCKAKGNISGSLANITKVSGWMATRKDMACGKGLEEIRILGSGKTISQMGLESTCGATATSMRESGERV